ncbi:MAG: hypothetical protein EKK48_02380 [Candidatus Melainabacteria bacterium]|nr:MAG: hypothetical protein EKK48_02380 [Candidatus Melainabacteria bacterium]
MADEKNRSGGSDPLSKRILNSIKPFSGEQTSKWLAALSTDAIKDAVVIKNDADPNQEPPRSMAAWVDGLFDHFQRYAYDFSVMCTEPELQVNCTRPAVQDSKVPVSPGAAPDTSVVTVGYLSTNKWALVVRGEFFRIQVYVVPVGVLMGFKARHEEFPLYMEMIAAPAARNKINWTLDGKPVSMNQASAIAKRLFAHLIMVARGEAKDTDKFSLDAKPPTAPAPELPARPESFGTSNSKVELLKPEWLLEENPSRPTPPRASFAPVSQPLPQQSQSQQSQSQQIPSPQSQVQQSQSQQMPAPQYSPQQHNAPYPQPPTQPGSQQMPANMQQQRGSQPYPMPSQGVQPQMPGQMPQPGLQQVPAPMQRQTGPNPQLPPQAPANAPLQYPSRPQPVQPTPGQPQPPNFQSQQQQSSTGPQQGAVMPGYPQQPASPGQPFGSPPFRQSQEMQSQTGPQQYFANQQAAGRQGGYPVPQIGPVGAPAAQPSQPQNSNQASGKVQELLQQNLVLVLNDCNQFASAVDQQLELLTNIGVKSIQNHDMDTASDVMQRAKKLKALLDAVVSFTNEWKANTK